MSLPSVAGGDEIVSPGELGAVWSSTGLMWGLEMVG